MLFQFTFSLLQRERKYVVTIESILCTIYERGFYIGLLLQEESQMFGVHLLGFVSCV